MQIFYSLSLAGPKYPGKGKLSTFAIRGALKEDGAIAFDDKKKIHRLPKSPIVIIENSKQIYQIKDKTTNLSTVLTDIASEMDGENITVLDAVDKVVKSVNKRIVQNIDIQKEQTARAWVGNALKTARSNYPKSLVDSIEFNSEMDFITLTVAGINLGTSTAAGKKEPIPRAFNLTFYLEDKEHEQVELTPNPIHSNLTYGPFTSYNGLSFPISQTISDFVVKNDLGDIETATDKVAAKLLKEFRQANKITSNLDIPIERLMV